MLIEIVCLVVLGACSALLNCRLAGRVARRHRLNREWSHVLEARHAEEAASVLLIKNLAAAGRYTPEHLVQVVTAIERESQRAFLEEARRYG